MEYLLVMLIIMSVLTPILCIASFIVGYNVNAPKKIMKIRKKSKEELTEDEKMLQRIDNAKVY